MTAPPLANLINELTKLPGVGGKSAARLAYHILKRPAAEAEALAAAILDVKTKIFRCSVCNNTGYKGRVGFYQVMPMLEQIREMVLSGANTGEIKRESMRLGVKSMRQAALTKLEEGVTSFEEVLRCTIADD